MNLAAQLRSDTLTLLLAYRMNQSLPPKLLMHKIRLCSEILRSRTHDGVMITAYSKIIKAINNRRYSDVVILMHVAEANYQRIYMNV